MNNNIEYVSVTELNRYLYYKFDQDKLLQQVYLEGELSNCKKSGNHYYFSLKDENSEISGMFFYPANLSLTFIPKDGMSVQVVGKIQVYQKRGTYSIVALKMTECGVGILYQKYLELKDKLDKEGLFLESHKMPIPDYAENVGIITAATGEAINDIVSTFNRRFPLAKLTLYPALVQGADAPKDLIRALDLAYRNIKLDVLIIGRGGGSFEDLNCFNDEELARKLYEAPFPTISAVGHEGDYTICDFVCSYRAPTPTGAAMSLTKLKEDVVANIVEYSKRLKSSIKLKVINSFNQLVSLNTSYGLAKFDEIIKSYEQKVIDLNNRLTLLTPAHIAQNLSDKINDYEERIGNAIKKCFESYDNTINNLKSRIRSEMITDRINHLSEQVQNIKEKAYSNFVINLEKKESVFKFLVEKSTILNPLNIIKKGYSIVYQDDQIVYNVDELKIDEAIKIKFSNGVAVATVNQILKEEKNGK